MARTEYDYDSNGLARVYEDAQWFLLDRNGNQVGERTHTLKNGEKDSIRQNKGQRRIFFVLMEASS